MKFYADYILKQGNKYLVSNDNLQDVIDTLHKKQEYFCEFAAIVVKLYTGKKYSGVSWIIEG